MKKIFAFAAMMAAAVFTSFAGATAIVKGGVAQADVVLDLNAPNRQMAYAAQELTNWVAKITGAELRVVTNAAEATQGVRIVLGTPETCREIKDFAKGRSADFARLADNDGFIIAEERGFLGFGTKRIYLAAGRSKGVLNAVYRFLEKNSDIIWVRPMKAEDGFGTVYGKTQDMFNSVENLVDVPSFGHHRYWSGSGDWGKGFIYRHQARILNCCDVWWEARNSRDSVLYADCTDLQRSVDFGLGAAYTNEWIECFPLVRGKRDTGHDHQICYSHPKTLELFTREMRKRIKESPEVKTWFKGVGDNWSLCECEFCKKDIVCPNGKVVKFDDPNFRSTQYNLFLNRLEENLKKEFPDFGTIRSDAYLFNASAPAFDTGRPVGPYCPYIKNHKKPVFDDDVNKHWHAVAEDYNRIGMPFFSLYEYYLCCTTPRFPHAVCEVAQQDYKYYLNQGMKGVYLDGGNSDGSDNDGHHFDVSAIEFWTMSRLMWNVNIDVRETRHEFCRRAYREAADIMIEYHDKIAGVYNADPAGCFWNDAPIPAANHYIVEKGLAKWVRDKLAAAEAAARHPSSKELIRRHRAWMETLISEAEKMPKKISMAVPQAKAAPETFDPENEYWKKAAKFEPLNPAGRPNVPSDGKTAAFVCHDKFNLYFLFDIKSKRYLDVYRKYEADGLLCDRSVKKGEHFDWDCTEFFIAGDLGDKGSYYHLAFAYNGMTHSGQGPTELENPPEWHAKIVPTENGLRAIAAIPLEAIGMSISKGNKIDMNFTCNNTSWNGGQWHSPTSFQILVLQME